MKFSESNEEKLMLNELTLNLNFIYQILSSKVN